MPNREEMDNDAANHAPEACLANALEVAHDPQGTPLEVPFSTAFEHNHDPQEFPPEVGHSQGLEALAQDSSFVSSEQSKRIQRRINWNWTLVIGFAILAVVIGGGVGGLFAQKRWSVSPRGDAHRILRNTSVAATSCISDDRYVFFQDITGAIRGVQYSASTLKWNLMPEALNFTNAKAGTALGASCVYEAKSGLYISLIYLNQSDALQQTLYNEGHWKNSAVSLAANPPSRNTKLSISTLHQSRRPNSKSNLTYVVLQSTAIYQYSQSLMIVDLNPVASTRITNTKNTILADIEESQALQNINIGFACRVVPKSRYLECYIGSGLYGLSFEDSLGAYPLPGVYLRAVYLDYTGNSTGNSSMARTRTTYEESYGPSLIGSDISIVPLADNQTAIVFLQPNNTIALGVKDPYHRHNFTSLTHTSCSTVLPYSYFSATTLSSNSTLVYVYYQINETYIGELTYNTMYKTWNSQPTHVSVF